MAAEVRREDLNHLFVLLALLGAPSATTVSIHLEAVTDGSDVLPDTGVSASGESDATDEAVSIPMNSPDTAVVVSAESVLWILESWTISSSTSCNVPYPSMLIGVLELQRTTWQSEQKLVETRFANAPTRQNRCLARPGATMAGRRTRR